MVFSGKCDSHTSCEAATRRRMGDRPYPSRHRTLPPIKRITASGRDRPYEASTGKASCSVRTSELPLVTT